VGALLLRSAGKLSSGTKGRSELIGVGVAVLVADLIFVCIVIATRKSIRVAIVCLEEATQALVDLKVRRRTCSSRCVEPWCLDCSDAH
jgi:hypothetical protein